MTITAIFEKARVDGTAVRVAMMGDEVAINGEWFGMEEVQEGQCPSAVVRERSIHKMMRL